MPKNMGRKPHHRGAQGQSRTPAQPCSKRLSNGRDKRTVVASIRLGFDQAKKGFGRSANNVFNELEREFLES
jgi:hypothetical protein